MRSLLFILPLLLAYEKCNVEDAGSVETSATTGTYVGLRQGCSQDGKMVYWNEYRGIRYGRKPVRFEKPVPVASSSNTKTAKEYANMCVQYRKTGYDR